MSETIIFFGTKTVVLPGVGIRGGVFQYGDEVVLTDELREVNRDRAGWSWVDLLDDEDEQCARYGKVLFARGPWPVAKSRIEPGSQAWNDERERLRAEAYAVPDEIERGERLRRIGQQWGRPKTSTTTMQYRGANDGQRHD